MEKRYFFQKALDRYFYVYLVIGFLSIFDIVTRNNFESFATTIQTICLVLVLVYSWNLYNVSGNKKMKILFFTQLLTIGVSFSTFVLFPSLLNTAYMVTLSLLIIYIIINLVQIYLSLSFFKEEIATIKIKSLYPVILIISIITMITELIVTTIYSPLGALGSSSTICSIVYIYYLYVCRSELKLDSRIDTSTLNNDN
ncbi:MAG: hypothetical protein RR565_06980 [Erysipelothrix sp.]